MKTNLKFLFIGDVVGLPGLTIFQKWIPKLKEKYSIDAVIVNGENAAKNGRGITSKLVDFFKHNGASVITTGNHVWENREFYNTLNQRDDVIRPANFPPGCPGKGFTIFDVNGFSVAMVNLHGRVFVKDLLDCPFRTIETLLVYLKTRTNLIFIDFHAEATSEKKALGFYLDGKISGFLGTHTHVQTADAQILPKGTAYMTDLGFCGAVNSIIGMEPEGVLKKFLYFQKMGKFEVEHSGPFELSGACVTVDCATGLATHIESVHVIDNDLHENLVS